MAEFREPMTMRPKSRVLEQEPHSPWHSPVAYMFGGLGAMLGLVAFVVLIFIAYSFWKLSGYNEEARRDLESGEAAKIKETQKQKAPTHGYEEQIVVVMAGQERATFIATPMWSSRSCSFGDNTDISSTSSCAFNKTDG